MAPESATGKSKNLFAQLGFPRPRSSRTPSRSTSPNPSNLPTTHQEPQQHGLENPVKTAWKATEVALRLLEKSADVFPPLKSAVGGLVACLDLAKNVTGNQEEYVKLAEELKKMAGDLEPYASQLAADGDGGSIALILKSIDKELVEIKEQQDRSMSKKIFEAADDRGDIPTRYRKINSLFQRLLSDVTLRNKIEIGTLRVEATEAILLTKLKPVDDAKYDSEYSTTVQRRGCTASTREAILSALKTWAKDPAGSKMFWMNGMAGTGKTTILYSFCEWLEENRQLAGNFFCSRASTSCRDLNNIVRSIAYQLTQYSPAFRSELCKILKEKQNPHRRKVEEQFKWILAKPLENSMDAITDGAVIVIDALDECGDVLATALFLKVLMSYATHLPIKFLVASRPEPVILKNMQTSNFSPSVLRLHDIEQSLVEADIKKYLQEDLRTMAPPPSSDVIDQLTRQSGKLFIYAATVARYVNPEDEVVNSKSRLDLILGISSSSASLQEQELDRLYRSILSSAFDKTRLEERELKIAYLVLRTVICAIEPMTTCTMSIILALQQEDVTSTLSRLQSVLHVQEGPYGLVSILHASFSNFLCNRDRSHEFYCNIMEHNTQIMHSCFDVMCKELHFNMCKLESSYDFDKDIPELDKDVPDLAQKIQANISAGLLYACKYWSNHLVRCDLTSSIHYRLVEFLKFRLLFWMEVLNLTKCISMGSQMLSNVLAWFICKAPDHVFKETEKELYDTDLFVKTFSLGACKKSTPHIYISALPFCYKSNSVYQNYWTKTNGLLVVNGTSLTQRNGPIGVWKTNADVNTVAFSPDGSTFSAGYSNRVNIRDIQSGKIVFNLLLEDTELIVSLVFSPDNSKIAAGSENGNIWIWDIQTASYIAGPLHMEERGVQALAFSSDSRKLASYSGSTIIVWDSSSGKMLSGPFDTEDLGDYGSFAFTPDNSNIIIVSSVGMVHVLDAYTGFNDLGGSFEVTVEGARLTSTAISSDTTIIAIGFAIGYDSDSEVKDVIHIWNIHARAMTDVLAGRNGHISALAFSHDGKKLISGSSNHTIRIWDIATGNGHTSTICSLALSSSGTKLLSGSEDQCVCLCDIAPPCQIAWSPDGTRIASGQYGGTVAVWSAQNGEASSISSIAFSPDSSRITAGTMDGAVVSWDLRTGEMVETLLQGHSDAVLSIAYSPDGSIIASASSDCTIIIWDCSTEEMIGKPLMAFTPDGNRLISGVKNGSIYIWDVHTGQTILDPIKGNTDRAISSIACSPDGNQFVSVSFNGTLCMWSLTTGEMTAGPFDADCRGIVNSVAYSQDGTKIIFGSGYKDFGAVYVLDAKTGNILASIAGHTAYVVSVAVSPDGSKFVSGSWDSSVRVWQLDILTSPESLRNAPTIWMRKDIIIPTISNIARYYNEGWVGLDGAPLFWAPPEFRADLCYPYNPITIGPHGTTRIDYSSSKLFIGRNWSKCWKYGYQD
ncbi:WD40 repeat-like protein [Agrocybe pediades]|nr:WD40 repeat-like protein [Agrocybe pediades]